MRGMTIIVKKVTQLIAGVIFLFGLYVVTHGHLTPGGGFAGGAIIAGAFILLILAFGSDVIKLRAGKEGSSSIESIALLAFLIFGTAALWLVSNIFFSNYMPLGIVGNLISAGVIPLYNILIGVEVAAALLSIFLGFLIYKEEAL